MSSSCQDNRYGREKAAVRPVHHVQYHTCRVSLLQQARLAAVLGKPSSLRPHWSEHRGAVETTQVCRSNF